MLDDLVYGIENRNIPSLYPSTFGELLRTQLGQNGIGFVERLLNAPHELFTCTTLLCGKFAGPIAHVRRSANRADDPLPNIAVEVEHQITNAVRFVVRSPPEHLRRKRGDGFPKLDPILVSEVGARTVDEVLFDAHVSVLGARYPPPTPDSRLLSTLHPGDILGVV